MLSPASAAIYLVGHGSSRDPRLIDVQYQRILRSEKAIMAHVGPFNVDKVFVDFNSPREHKPENSKEAFPEFLKLIAALDQGQYSIVLYDVVIGLERAFDMAFAERSLQSLRSRGVQLFNCSNLPQLIEPKRKPDPDVIVRVEPDYFDFMAFHPRLAARLAEKILEIEEQRLRLQQSIDGLPSEALTIEGFRKAIQRLADRTHRDSSPVMPKNYEEVCDLAEQLRNQKRKP